MTIFTQLAQKSTSRLAKSMRCHANKNEPITKKFASIALNNIHQKLNLKKSLCE